MTSKYIVPFMFVLSISCNGQKDSGVGGELANAKWYYYSYAIELNAYDSNNVEVQPLSCDIKLLKLLKTSTDTTKIFFQAFSKDTLNVCSFRPLNLVGIAVVRNKLYLPIYHTIIFDVEKDSVVLERMNKQSLLLQSKVLESNEAANSWLQIEAKRRKYQ